MRIWLTVLVLIVSLLTACASTPEAAPQNNSQPGLWGNGKDNHPSSTRGLADDGTEKLTIHLMSPSWAGGGWADNNHPVIEKLNEKLNIELKIQWVPAESYIEKIHVLAASNNLPDVYYLNTNFLRWRERGQFMDIKPYLDNYPDQFPNLRSNIAQYGYEIMNPKGKYYGLPYYGIETRDSLVIRQDWMDELGLQMPATVDEMYEVLKAFVYGDPDRNGINDTIGFSMSVLENGGFGYVDYLMGAFGLANGWKDVDGKLVPVQVQRNELKAFVAFLRKAYDEGVLDKDFPTNKTDDPMYKFAGGKLGMNYANPNELYTTLLPALQRLVPDAKLAYLVPPKGPTGLRASKTATITNKVVIQGKINVKKQERILKMLDYLVSDEGTILTRNGLEGIHYRMNADRTYRKLEAFDSDRPFLLSSWFFRRFDPATQERLWDDPVQSAKTLKMFEENAKYAWPNAAIGIETETMNKRFTDLNIRWTAALVKIIIGLEPMQMLDKAIADWRADGGDQIIIEVNEEYQKLQ
ncbi:extracellular solute-binding protein [Paenibacillus sp. GM2]|uniref:extracellular solute-binding protein n=1 Tax=Paenibacillus sp. GM2 TaxID=1622070 RepID=UPI000838E3AA|nr:extracellular solute-binding protein [Paenibacillus sp. GM2]